MQFIKPPLDDLEFKIPFMQHQARDAYWLMPQVFKDAVPFAAIHTAMEEGQAPDVKEAFDIARYLDSVKSPLYPTWCGRLAHAVIERFEPMAALGRVQKLAPELMALYWEQMWHLRYTLVYKDEEITNYSAAYAEEVLTGNDRASLELGKEVLRMYEEGNGISCNLILITYSYSAICNITHFFWVLTQLEPLATLDEWLRAKYGIKE
jgi:hypothetical protein